ncbi:MAG: flagellar FliJ family protein [Oscillospiraceae bacterium]|nr:flagellar FliJ family protein [Oscillospiraceae bacterium]
MKKFRFTLQSLYDYKLTVEKNQKAELKNAEQALRILLDEEQKLLRSYAETALSLEKALIDNIDVALELSKHDAYFKYLREAIKEIREKIVKAEEIVAKCRQALIRTMKELKTYSRLREEQYQSYLKEAKAEEEKETSDLVSYKTIIESGENNV